MLPEGNKCILCDAVVTLSDRGHRVSPWCDGCIERAEILREVGFEAFARAWQIIKDVKSMDWPEVVE